MTATNVLSGVNGLYESLQSARAVIFDFDGTLVDSLWVWKEVYSRFYRKRGLQADASIMKKTEGYNFIDTAKFVKSTLGLPDTLEALRQEWLDDALSIYATRVKLKSGVKELLLWLIRRAIPFGIATSNEKKLVTACLESNGLANVFTVIKTTSETQKSKPDPSVYQEVAKEFSVQPASCLVFEDTIAGVTGALRGSMVCVHIEDKYNKDDWPHLRDLAHFSIRGFSSLLHLLN